MLSPAVGQKKIPLNEYAAHLIEKAATEKAVRDIEEALAPAFAIRRKHREQTGLPYYDMSIFTSGRYPAPLPEALAIALTSLFWLTWIGSRPLSSAARPEPDVPSRWASCSPVTRTLSRSLTL